jgi:DNA-binding Lrp family transcriptional regulator
MSLAGTDTRMAVAWRVAQPTAAFVLRIEAASRNTQDLVDGLMFAAIQAANVSAISGDPELQLRYATLADSPPDELRRPVSISAIAHSLRMPFETVRRRVQRQARTGTLVMTPRGMLVSHTVLGHSIFLANVFKRHEELREFYTEVKALDALPAAPPAHPTLPAWDAPPLRLTNRLIWEYMLRVADDLGATVGDTTNGLILLAMARENTEGFDPEALNAWARDPLAVARPVRNGRLAQSLNFSTETLRRYVIALESRGLCVRGPLGLVAVAPPFFREGLERMVQDNLVNLQRLFTRLRQFGVLSMWDAPPAQAATGTL